METEGQNSTMKNAPIGPGFHERAWNDPPLYSKQANITIKAAPKKFNQRVPFPMTSTAKPVVTDPPLLPLISGGPPPSLFTPSLASSPPGETK